METKKRQLSQDKRLPIKDWANVLDLYRGCMGNADELLSESELLLNNGKYARALALSILAFEEVGKGQIVADLFNGMISKAEFEKAFRSHSIKSAYNHRKFVINTVEKVNHIEYDESAAKRYDALRMNVTYVGLGKDYKPIKPSSYATRDEAERFSAFVRKTIDEIRAYEMITERIGSKAFMK